MDHIDYVQRAVALSREKMRAGEGGPFAAVVVKDGQVVGEGWNRVSSSLDPTAHAEVNAIRDACERLGTFWLEESILYSSCEPCPMCLAAIYWARIPAVYYANTTTDAAAIGFEDAFVYAEVALPAEQRSVLCRQVPSEEALAVFAEWASMPDRIEY
jgi:tRNA(Arg) A34 adenosine deaminase TadA